MDEDNILSFNEILVNPSGKGSAAVARRSSIISDLSRRADQLFNEHRPRYEFFKDGSDFIIHFKHKSEHDKYNVEYDTILQLSPPEDSDKTERFISNYTVKMYSNIPSFMFIYAYVVNQNGWLIPEFKDHVSKKALEDEPSVRNPDEQMGFEKSIFFTAYFIRKNNLTLVSKLATIGKTYTLKRLAREIPTSEEKLVEYNKAKAKVVADNKKKRKIEKDKRDKEKLAAAKAKRTSSRSRITKSKTRKNKR